MELHSLLQPPTYPTLRGRRSIWCRVCGVGRRIVATPLSSTRRTGSLGARGTASRAQLQLNARENFRLLLSLLFVVVVDDELGGRLGHVTASVLFLHLSLETMCLTVRLPLMIKIACG